MSARRRGWCARLPLAVSAGALSAVAVLASVVAVAAVLGSDGRLGAPDLAALGAGLVAGLLASLVSVVAARRLAAALRDVRAEAALRLDDPSPVEGRPRGGALARELAELSETVEALQWRVRVADGLAERRRTEAATTAAGVQELLSGLVAAEEAARGQLAAELHDTVAQSLALARGLLSASPSHPAELGRIADHVEDAEEQVRAVMARTRPPALRDGDLAAAVVGLRDDVRARYGLEVHIRWPSTPVPLPLAAAVTVYRFFQEGLLNVVKHADVEEVHLALEVLPDAVVATVRDEGAGFEPEQVRPQRGRHVGLGLLSERARLAGGQLEVRSGGGWQGTLVRLRLPRPVAAVPEPAPVRVPTPRTPLAAGLRRGA